jgi:hypothetical protein
VPIIARQIERAYTDIERQDSSKELRNKARAFWGVGEHLWDVDVTNNFVFLNWWLGATVYWYRIPRAPWQVPPHYTDPDFRSYATRTGSCSLVYVNRQGNGYSQAPFQGVKAYIQADYMYVGFTGTEWRPICEVPLWKRRVEISVFVSATRPNELTKIIVDRPFMLPASDRYGPNGPFSCCRGLTPGTSRAIFKNEQLIGAAYQGQQSWENGIVIDEDTVFEEGDILAIAGGLRNASFSFFGKAL